jgi:hypothetical protein
MTMRRIAFVLISAVATVVMGATAALADSPHFLFADNSISSSTGALNTSFKDAGLGTGTASIQITLTVDNATAVYQCFNNGGNPPPGREQGNRVDVADHHRHVPGASRADHRHHFRGPA